MTRLPHPLLADARRADAQPTQDDPGAAARVARAILALLPREAPADITKRRADLAAATRPLPRKAAHV